jgi:phosphatidate cytidylyltransferase
MAKKRIITGLIFIPCILLIARKGELYFLIMVIAIIAGGIWEFYRMTGRSITRPYKLLGTAGAVLLPVFFYFRLHEYLYLLITLTLLGVIITELCTRERKFFVYNVSVTIFGIFYVGFLGSHILLIREIPELEPGMLYSDGFNFVVLLFLLTWCYDTGAYAVGRLAGRKKLFPAISPGKTLEGSIGGVIFAVAGIVIARSYLFPFLGMVEAVGLAVLMSITGQTGDLVESMIKRDMNRKDSSEAIPGHGGILDRFDSMLFNAPMLYYLLVFFFLAE